MANELPSHHRQRLAETIRRTSLWRERVAVDKDQNPSARAARYLGHLAEYVERELPRDDQALRALAQSPISTDGRSYLLTKEGRTVLSRFGTGQNSVSYGAPDNKQMRNLLSMVEGIERKARQG